MDDTASDPPVLTRRQVLAGAASGALLASCTSGQRRPPPTTTSPPAQTTTTAGPRQVKIGYAAEVTGANSGRGTFVKACLDAFLGYVNDKLGGKYRGIVPELIPVDVPTDQAGPGAYADLVARGVAGIVWCSPFGLVPSLAGVASGNVPVVSVLSDLYSPPVQYPLEGTSISGSMVFQTMLPDAFAFDVMLAYGAEDRGFSTAAMLFDSANFPHAAALFTAAAAKHNLVNQGVFSYDTSSGHVDLAGPLNTLKKAGLHCLVVYGLADQASVVANQLLILDAKYVNTPTTLRSRFKPMLMGTRWGTGDPTFVRLAGDAASRGTLTPMALSHVPTLPNLPLRRWLKDYVPSYNGGAPGGGENGPVDAVTVLLDAAARAGSTRGPDLVAALEHGTSNPVASTIGVTFTADRHLAVTRDDTALTTMEFRPEPFNLGNEWREILAGDYQGPTHLVDFTLPANVRAHPIVVQDFLARRYGTSASDDYQGGDPGKVAACRALH